MSAYMDEYGIIRSLTDETIERIADAIGKELKGPGGPGGFGGGGGPGGGSGPLGPNGPLGDITKSIASASAAANARLAQISSTIGNILEQARALGSIEDSAQETVAGITNLGSDLSKLASSTEAVVDAVEAGSQQVAEAVESSADSIDALAAVTSATGQNIEQSVGETTDSVNALAQETGAGFTDLKNETKSSSAANVAAVGTVTGTLNAGIDVTDEKALSRLDKISSDLSRSSEIGLLSAIVKAATSTTGAVRSLAGVINGTSVGSLISKTIKSPLVGLTSAVDQIAREFGKTATQNVSASPLAELANKYFKVAASTQASDLNKLGNFLKSAVGQDKEGTLYKDPVATALSTSYFDTIAGTIGKSIEKTIKDGKLSLDDSAIKQAYKPLKDFRDSIGKGEADKNLGFNLRDRDRAAAAAPAYAGLINSAVDRQATESARRIKAGESKSRDLNLQAGSKNVIGMFSSGENEGFAQNSQDVADTINKLFFKGKANAVGEGVNKDIQPLGTDTDLGKLISQMEKFIPGLSTKMNEQLAYFTRGSEEIAAAIYEAIQGGVAPEDIVMVGHSSGGMRAAQVQEILSQLGIEGVKTVQNAGVHNLKSREEQGDKLTLASELDNFTGGLNKALGATTDRNASAAGHEFFVTIADPKYQEQIAKFLGTEMPKTFDFETFKEPKQGKRRDVEKLGAEAYAQNDLNVDLKSIIGSLTNMGPEFGNGLDRLSSALHAVIQSASADTVGSIQAASADIVAAIAKQPTEADRGKSDPEAVKVQTEANALEIKTKQEKPLEVKPPKGKPTDSVGLGKASVQTDNLAKVLQGHKLDPEGAKAKVEKEGNERNATLDMREAFLAQGKFAESASINQAALQQLEVILGSLKQALGAADVERGFSFGDKEPAKDEAGGDEAEDFAFAMPKLDMRKMVIDKMPFVPEEGAKGVRENTAALVAAERDLHGRVSNLQLPANAKAKEIAENASFQVRQAPAKNIEDYINYLRSDQAKDDSKTDAGIKKFEYQPIPAQSDELFAQYAASNANRAKADPRVADTVAKAYDQQFQVTADAFTSAVDQMAAGLDIEPDIKNLRASLNGLVEELNERLVTPSVSDLPNKMGDMAQVARHTSAEAVNEIRTGVFEQKANALIEGKQGLAGPDDSDAAAFAIADELSRYEKVLRATNSQAVNGPIGRLSEAARIKDRQGILNNSKDKFEQRVEYLKSPQAMTDFRETGAFKMPEVAYKTQAKVVSENPIEEGVSGFRDFIKTVKVDPYTAVVDVLDATAAVADKANKGLAAVTQGLANFGAELYTATLGETRNLPEGHIVRKGMEGLEAARLASEPIAKDRLLQAAENKGIQLNEVSIPVPAHKQRSIAPAAIKTDKAIADYSEPEIDKALQRSRKLSKTDYKVAFAGVSKDDKVAELLSLGEAEAKALLNNDAIKKSADAFKRRAKEQRNIIKQLANEGKMGEAATLYNQLSQDILKASGILGAKSLRAQQGQMKSLLPNAPTLPELAPSNKDDQVRFSIFAKKPKMQAPGSDEYAKLAESLNKVVAEVTASGFDLKTAFDKIAKTIGVEAYLKQTTKEGVNGYYQSSDRAVAVNRDLVDSQDVEQILDTLIHELVHAAQDQQGKYQNVTGVNPDKLENAQRAAQPSIEAHFREYGTKGLAAAEKDEVGAQLVTQAIQYPQQRFNAAPMLDVISRLGDAVSSPIRLISGAIQSLLAVKLASWLAGSAVSAIRAAESYRNLDNSLKQFSGGTKTLASVTKTAQTEGVSARNLGANVEAFQGSLGQGPLQGRVDKYALTLTKLAQVSGLDKSKRQALQTGFLQAAGKDPERVYSEEFKQQISEAMPAIGSALADVRGESTSDLQQSVKAGLVNVDQLMRAAENVANSKRQDVQGLSVESELLGDSISTDLASQAVPLEALAASVVKGLNGLYLGLGDVRGALGTAQLAVTIAAWVGAGVAAMKVVGPLTNLAWAAASAAGVVDGVKPTLGAFGKGLAMAALQTGALAAAFGVAIAALDAISVANKAQNFGKDLRTTLEGIGKEGDPDKTPQEVQSDSGFSNFFDSMAKGFNGVFNRKHAEAQGQIDQVLTSGAPIEKVDAKLKELGMTADNLHGGQMEAYERIKQGGINDPASLARAGKIRNSVDMPAVEASKQRESDLKLELATNKAKIIQAKAEGKPIEQLSKDGVAIQQKITAEADLRAAKTQDMVLAKAGIDKAIVDREADIAKNPQRENEMRPGIVALKKESEELRRVMGEINTVLDKGAQKMLLAFSGLDLLAQRNDRAGELDKAQTGASKQIALSSAGTNTANSVNVFNAKQSVGLSGRDGNRIKSEVAAINNNLSQKVSGSFRKTVEALSGVKIELMTSADVEKVKQLSKLSGTEIPGLDELGQVVGRKDQLQLKGLDNKSEMKAAQAELQNAIYNQNEALYQYYKSQGRQIEDLNIQISRQASDLANQAKQVRLGASATRIQTALDLAKQEVSNKFAGITSDFGRTVADTMTEWFEAVTSTASVAVDNALNQVSLERSISDSRNTLQDTQLNYNRGVQDRGDEARQMFGGNVPQQRVQQAQVFQEQRPTAQRLPQRSPDDQARYDKVQAILKNPNVPQHIKEIVIKEAPKGLLNEQRTERSTVKSAPTQYGNSIKHFGSSDLARIIGTAEGTRTAKGGYTRAYAGHTDPGNAVHNVGSYSYQHGGTAQQADQRQYSRLSALVPEFHKVAAKQGVQVTPKLLANYLDSYNQSPMAAREARGGTTFLNGVGSLRGRENDSEAILRLRERTYTSGGQNRIAGLSVRQDQGRRVDAIDQALNAGGGFSTGRVKQTAQRSPQAQSTLQAQSAPSLKGVERGTQANISAAKDQASAQQEQNNAKFTLQSMKLGNLLARLGGQVDVAKLARNSAERQSAIAAKASELDPQGLGMADNVIADMRAKAARADRQEKLQADLSQAATAMERAAEMLRSQGKDPASDEIYQSLGKLRDERQAAANAESATADLTEKVDAQKRLQSGKQEISGLQGQSLSAQQSNVSDRLRLEGMNPQMGIVRRADLESRGEVLGMKSSSETKKLEITDLKAKIDALKVQLNPQADGTFKPDSEMSPEAIAQATEKLALFTTLLGAANEALSLTGEAAQSSVRGYKMQAAAKEVQNVVRSKRLDVLGQADSALTGDPFSGAGRYNKARAGIATQRSQLQLEQTLADIDANAENYASYPGGVEALKKQMTELAAVDLSNTIKGMDSFRQGLRDTFSGAFMGLRDDLANPDVSFGDAFANMGNNLLEGISKQYMQAGSDGLANKMATALPGGDLTAKNSPQAQKGGGLFGAPTGGMPAVSGLPMAGGAVLVSPVNALGVGGVGGAQLAGAITPQTQAGGAIAAPAQGGGGGALGLGLMFGLTAMTSIMQGKKAKRAAKEEKAKDPETYWQTGAQWKPDGKGSNIDQIHQYTGDTIKKNVFDPAISATRTLSQGLDAAAVLANNAATANNAVTAQALGSQSNFETRQNIQNNRIQVTASNLRSFRSSESVIQSSLLNRQQQSRERLGG